MNQDLNFQINFLRQSLKSKPCKIRIISNSMHPLIKQNEEIVITSVDIHTLKRFDIIVYEYYGKTYCHFFWTKLLDNKVVTKSLKDVLNFDVPIEEKDIIGIVLSKRINTAMKMVIYFKILTGIK